MSLSSGIAINSVVRVNNVVTVVTVTPQPAQYYGFAWDGIGWSV